MLNQTSFESSWEFEKSVDFSFFSFLPFLFEAWVSCSVKTALFSLCWFLQGWFSRDWKVLKPEPGLEVSVFHLVFYFYCDLCATKFEELSMSFFCKCKWKKTSHLFCLCLTKIWCHQGAIKAENYSLGLDTAAKLQDGKLIREMNSIFLIFVAFYSKSVEGLSQSSFIWLNLTEILCHVGWHGWPHIRNHIIEISQVKQNKYFWRENLGPFHQCDLLRGLTQLHQHGSAAKKRTKAWSGSTQICVHCWNSHVFWPTISFQRESYPSLVMAGPVNPTAHWSSSRKTGVYGKMKTRLGNLSSAHNSAVVFTHEL